MALNAISNLAPALVPIVVKLIDNFFSADEYVIPPEMREKRERNSCHCEIRGPPSRYDINQCSACSKPYPKSDVSKQYLNLPTVKSRSMSTSDTYENKDKLGRNSARKGRSLSESSQKRSSNDDTLIKLGRRLEEEAMRVNGTKYKSPSSRGAIKKSAQHYGHRKPPQHYPH